MAAYELGYTARVNFNARSCMESCAYSGDDDDFSQGMMLDFDQQQQRGAPCSQQFTVSIPLDSSCLPSHLA